MGENSLVCTSAPQQTFTPLAPSISVRFSLHRLAAEHPKSADIMLLSKWHSSGEKLLLYHMEFKWNWNNNPCVKCSISLPCERLQCVGCISQQRNTLRPRPALNSLWYTTWIKKKKINKKNSTQQNKCSTKSLLIMFRNSGMRWHYV